MVQGHGGHKSQIPGMVAWTSEGDGVSVQERREHQRLSLTYTLSTARHPRARPHGAGGEVAAPAFPEAMVGAQTRLCH